MIQFNIIQNKIDSDKSSLLIYIKYKLLISRWFDYFLYSSFTTIQKLISLWFDYFFYIRFLRILYKKIEIKIYLYNLKRH